MEKEKQQIKEIAFKYFNGNMTTDEAALLFTHIEESEENKSIFKHWENEWFSTIEHSALLNETWDAFDNARESDENIRSLIPVGKMRNSYLMIAASVALLIIGSVLGAIYWYGEGSAETFYTMETPYGQKSKITLADGSIVWLNSGSKLTYSDKFGKKHREVQLQGEGYFEVQKNKKEFIVKTARYSIAVKGTKFNVSAYSDDAYSSTTLLEGKVNLFRNQRIININPGETLRLNLSSNTFTRTNSGASNAKAWTNDRIQYDNIGFAELLKKLSRAYNQPIVLMNEGIKNQHFSISIRNKQSLQEVLAAIGKTVPINIKNENDTIKIK